MSDNTDLEEFSSARFEDEADMLEFAYEKIENSIFIWALWCKTFAPEMSDEVSRSLAIEFLTEIHKQIAPRISIMIDRKEAGNVLFGFVQKYKSKRDQASSLSD
jgi:hypothetical protein